MSLHVEDVQTNIDEPSDQMIEKSVASVLRELVAGTRAPGFPTLLYADSELSGVRGHHRQAARLPHHTQVRDCF